MEPRKVNYYFDSEFIEGKQPKRFLGITYGWTKPIIDPISIGITSADGRTYYAVSNEFNLNWAWKDNWIRDSVLLKIYEEWVIGDERNILDFCLSTMRYLVDMYGKSNKLIASEMFMFTTNPSTESKDSISDAKLLSQAPKHEIDPIFWAYYASTDWVVLYQLWGKMIEAPKAYPMFVMDLNQKMIANGLSKEWKRKHCPEPENAHNALADAIWNRQLDIAIDKFVFEISQDEE